MPFDERVQKYAIAGAIRLAKLAERNHNFATACTIYGDVVALLDHAQVKTPQSDLPIAKMESQEKIYKWAYSSWQAMCDAARFQGAR